MSEGYPSRSFDQKWENRERGDKGEKGGKGEKRGKGEKGSYKGGGKGRQRQEKIVSKDLRGKITKFIEHKPSGFIQRADGERDVYFDLVDVVDGVTVEKDDPVEFDVVEGTDGRLYAARVKKLSKDTPLSEESRLLRPAVEATASKAGSLTGATITLGPSTGSGKLTGGLFLRPGGTLSPGGGLAGTLSGSLAPEKKKEEPKPAFSDDHPLEIARGYDEDGVTWGRIVSVRQSFGFLLQLGAGGTDDKGDIFFRAADVVGINCNELGEDGVGLQITLPPGRISNGVKSFWLAPDDEVSYMMSKDHTGKPCAVDIRKERKGAWRMGRRGGAPRGVTRRETLKEQMKRLTEMEADQVLQNASLFKEVLESPEFNPSHLYKIVTLLASKELAEDTRSDRLYRVFLDSSAMQASLRTTIIKQSSGKHCGTFLEDCLRLLLALVLRSSNPQELRGQLPLTELVEALEMSVRSGSTATRKGLTDEVMQMLKCLQKNFPDEVNLDRILGVKAPRVQRSAAEDYTELLEADYYQDMPILPTSAEMLGQCAFEIQENMSTYEKCDDFIQTHFMLLREDYIEPLRAGIKLFMQGRHSPKDLHVYTGVKVVGMLSTWEGLVYRLELQRSQIRGINWEKTKQLMYGSLLCFSDDNFETLLWATVWRRDEHLIATEGQIDVRLPFEPFDDRLAPGKVFCCIENVTIYFEAYRHVLIALQSMRPTDVPFQHTLLSPKPEPVPPGFLKAESDMFHFHNVFSTCEKVDAPISAPKSFKILQEWPETLQQSLDIDPSQLDAIKHALTHQVALIQGPPGTGKTWVGLKIVQALLDNTTALRHSPILVVCYTNHALDQFLEGIFRFCERIARIGSRSKSEQMKARNLKELVYETQPSKDYFHARKVLTERRDMIREELTKVLRDIDRHVVLLSDVKILMTETQWERFYKGFRDYLGDNARHVPEDPDDVEEDLWPKIMKEWLEISDPEKLAPVLPKTAGGLPTIDKRVYDADDDDLSPTAKELANDAEEEEADHETHDRKLDVEQADEKKQPQDFCMLLKHSWLPSLEEHVELLPPELRSHSWREEDNLWSIPVSLRRETYRQWLLEVHNDARELLPELARRLERNADSRAVLERERKLAVLAEMSVVGMTTTAVSKYQTLLRELRPEIVIVEEAAEVLEAHILTALHPRTQHVVLIGDHQQLRPSTAVYRLSKHFRLDVSLFERLIKNGADHVTLLQQRRMHPKISRLIKPLYPLLRDHMSTNLYPEILGVDARCFFLRHTCYEDDEGESHSKANTFEANFVSALVAHLVRSGYEESQITVLSPYLGQVRLLKNKLRRDIATMGVAVTAVDNFQGEENDIIIISLVRSNATRTMGFLAVENRINVALTRARHGMFIVGNADMLRGHQLWSAIMQELQNDGCISDRMPLIDKESGGIFEVSSSDDISVLLGDPMYETGFCGNGDSKANRMVADRWAELGKDDRDGKGKSRGKQDRGKGGDNGKGGRGDRDRDRGTDTSRKKNNRNDRDRGIDRDRGGKGKGDSYSRYSDDRGGDYSPSSRVDAREVFREREKAREAQAEQRVERPPPPAKMEADGVECELISAKDACNVEDADGKQKQAGGKKQKQKAGGKVFLMRCG